MDFKTKEDIVMFERICKIMAYNFALYFYKNEMSFCLGKNLTVIIKNLDDKSEVQFIDKTHTFSSYHYEKFNLSAKTKKLQLINWFIESFINESKSNDKFLNIFQRSIKENSIKRLETNIRKEARNFNFNDDKISFYITDVEVTCYKNNEFSMSFFVQFHNTLSLKRYETKSYLIENQNSKDLLDSFIAGLRYNNNKALLKALRQSVCNHSKKWVKIHGM